MSFLASHPSRSDPSQDRDEGSPAREITEVAVVVPARNEQRRIGAALDAILVAATTLTTSHPGVGVRVVVVLDRCTDATAQRLGEYPTVEAVTSNAGMVGAARALGISHVLATTRVAAQDLWLASTDADSRVPSNWLSHHHQTARSGAELLLGTVRPYLRGPALRAWSDRHILQDGHPHVHGANLGILADAYLAAGGFPHVAEHEDLILARTVRALGRRVVATNDAPVQTSARRTGRTPGGMAGYLRLLEP